MRVVFIVAGLLEFLAAWNGLLQDSRVGQSREHAVGREWEGICPLNNHELLVRSPALIRAFRSPPRDGQFEGASGIDLNQVGAKCGRGMNIVQRLDALGSYSRSLVDSIFVEDLATQDTLPRQGAIRPGCDPRHADTNRF